MNEDLLLKVYEKIEKVADDVGELKITSAKQEVNLQNHMRRTDILEELYVDLKTKEVDPLKRDIREIKGYFKIGLKFIGGLMTLGGLILGYLKYLGK